MLSKLFATILFGLVCLSTAPAHAQGRAIVGVLEWFGLFGRSAAADSRLLLREYEAGSLARDPLSSTPDYLSSVSRSRDLYGVQREFLIGRLTARGITHSDDFLRDLTDPLAISPYDTALRRLQLGSEDPAAVGMKFHDLMLAARNAQKDVADVAAGSKKATTSETGAANGDAAKADESSRLKFSVLDGKLKIGTLKKYENLEIEGGEINLYKWGAAGGAAALCNTIDCYKAARRAIIEETFKTKDLKEVLEGIEKAKKPELTTD
jgi:hypothetical protein